MPATPITLGQTLVASFKHGDDFFTELNAVCEEHQIRQGYIPMFVAGFRQARLVGTCDRVDDPEAPVWSGVHLENLEVLGGGTLAWDPEQKKIAPHLHITVGQKHHAASSHTSHLLDAEVQFVVEMIIQEVAEPQLLRIREPDLYNVPLLQFSAPK